jgi:hypothetical protein
VDIDAPNASLADFLMVGNSPQSIRWKLKDVQTFELEDFPEPGVNSGGLTFAGSLRPLYAYELRARVLEDLARFGLNVPPAVGSSAAATVVVAGLEQDHEFSLAPEGRAACSLVLSRGGADATQAIFYESAIARLITELMKLAPETLAAGEHRKALQDVQRKIAQQEKMIEKLTAFGLTVDEGAVAGIQITTKRIGRGTKERPWCQIVLSNEVISAATSAAA